MDLEWYEKQRKEMEKRFNPEIHKIMEAARLKEIHDLFHQDFTPRFSTTDISPIGKRAIPQELWKDQKIKDLEHENKELKRKLAMHVLTYNKGESA
ncbi:hypothetical protein [Acinetobacter baumannii]|uniref:hypothetical protein n=1 Tax=Acinetobacter baumannii TaxID=470 RepID=UPI000DD04EC3|nr:hypothetical protein [Acinetobacter baumannii]